MTRAAWRPALGRGALPWTGLSNFFSPSRSLGGLSFPPASAEEKGLTVFAAASMKNALDDVDAAYTAKTGVKVVASYAASSVLAKQIGQGAPADIFLSADTDWMDYASQTKNHQQGHADQPARQQHRPDRAEGLFHRQRDHRPGLRPRQARRHGRIATGDVSSVPVGKYAKAALEKLGAWETAAPKFAMAESVRAALTLVARGEAVLGIVYATDAKVEPEVKIVGTFPADSHPPIIYPVAATTTAGANATGYLAFLHSQAAKTMFEKYGFSFLVRPSS